MDLIQLYSKLTFSGIYGPFHSARMPDSPPMETPNPLTHLLTLNR